MDQKNVAPSDADRKITDLLMLKELPLLAGVVTVVVQPFGQIRQNYQDILPGWFPLLIAALISALLASYYVRTVKRTAREESFVLIPLVMLILFSGSIGANNLVDAASRGASASPEAIRAIEARENDLRSQLKKAEEELEIAREKSRLLRKALDLPEQEKLSVGAAPAGASLARHAETVLGFFVNDAIGQPAKPSERKDTSDSSTAGKTARNAELIRKLEELDRQQQQLQSERTQLKSKDVRSESEANVRPLWKSWGDR